MDYTRQPLAFQVRKAARYVRLYGPRRTVSKVRGQYHMRTVGRRPARLRAPGRADAHVGLIGCGNFAYSTIAFYLAKHAGPVIRGTMDAEPARAASLARRYRAHYFTTDAARIIEDPQIDLVYVASNHASHAEYAIRALEAGKSVHIEKPHVVTDDQLVQLCRAMRASRGRVALGFNRPGSQLGREAARLLGSQTGAAMLNWFVAGHEIPPDHWYYDEREGGRVLGNLCHWTDFVYRSIPPADRYPIVIRPTRALQSDTNIAVTYTFGDGSIAAITFSAKGHTFEGVKERFTAHRGDLLLALTDFKELTADVVDRRERRTLPFRDHGHEAAIVRSYGMSARAGARTPGSSIPYVWETAELFLRTREALEDQEVLALAPFSAERLDDNAAIREAALPAPEPQT